VLQLGNSRFVCSYPNQNARSERAQQYGGDEREYGEHGQHIEPQSKVHGRSPVLLGCDESLTERARFLLMTNILHRRAEVPLNSTRLPTS
jgi:hypothetical protein